MTGNNNGKGCDTKRVSFSCALVTASWRPEKSNFRRENAICCENVEAVGEGDQISLAFCAASHPTIDSFRLELELPLVTRYRVVLYFWHHCYRCWSHERLPPMPPRPINMESSREQYVHGCRDPEQEFGTISSTSLQLMDGITLRHLARLPDDAAHLHPFSRSLDPVARPIIAFLRRNCTSHLSRRQNNSICLLPKLMEIIFILCCQLERSTDAYKKRPRQKPNIRDKWGCVDSNTSPSSAETTRDGYPPRIPHTSSRDGVLTNLLNRCAWWLSGVHESTGKRSHRLFAQVKVLLLSPGPMCQVKAGYLRFLACRFFPELPAIYLPLSESSGASATAEGQRKESSELGGGYVYIPSVSNDTTTLKKCLIDMSEGRDICLYRYG